MRRPDRIYPRTLGPRELQTLRPIEQSPGITARELADRLGVTTGRVHQIVRRLEAGLVRPGRLERLDDVDVVEDLGLAGQLNACPLEARPERIAEGSELLG